MNLYTGAVFDIGVGDTSGMDMMNYLKQSGVDRFAEGDVDFDPATVAAQGNKLMQTGTQEFESYHNAVERAKSFGIQMASKGIDVTRPDANNPDAVLASNLFQNMMRRVEQEGAAAKTGLELAKLATEQRLKYGAGMIGPKTMTPGGRATTTQDLDRLYNLEPYRKSMETYVKSINDVHAKEYDTLAQRDAANHELKQASKGLLKYKQQMLQAGIPPEVVNSVVESYQSGIGSASYNPLEERKVASQTAENYAQAAAARRRNVGKDDEKAVNSRKEIIYKLQNEDADAIDLFRNKKVFGYTIEDAEYGFYDSNPVIYLTGYTDVKSGATTKRKKKTFKIDMNPQQGGGFTELWNLLNEVLNPIDLDKAGNYEDPNPEDVEVIPTRKEDPVLAPMRALDPNKGKRNNQSGGGFGAVYGTGSKINENEE